MLNVALVGLLASTLAVTPTDDGKKGTADTKLDAPAPVAAAAPAGPSIFTPAADSPDTIQDTYAFGIANRATPIKIWVAYAYGEAEGRWDTGGNTGEITVGAGTPIAQDGDIVSMRGIVGAELGLPVGLFGFGLSAGAQLTLAKNEFQVGSNVNAASPFNTGLESDFGLQAVKVYGIARAGAVGLHAGYQFDIADEQAFAPNAALGGLELPTDFPNSDGRDAIFFGADFDYPSDRIRLFGGVDYYDLQSRPNNSTTAADESTLPNGDDFINWTFGAGLKFSVFEIGAAALLQTRFSNPTVGNIGTAPGIGGSAGTIAPYLRISPSFIPATIFVKGAVLDEYTEYGYAIGGSNSIKPSIGFTAGLTVGFE